MLRAPVRPKKMSERPLMAEAGVCLLQAFSHSTQLRPNTEIHMLYRSVPTNWRIIQSAADWPMSFIVEMSFAEGMAHISPVPVASSISLATSDCNSADQKVISSSLLQDGGVGPGLHAAYEPTVFIISTLPTAVNSERGRSDGDRNVNPTLPRGFRIHVARKSYSGLHICAFFAHSSS